MANCNHYVICGLSDEADPKAGLCILHSKDPAKDRKAFASALDVHGKSDFTLIIFPEPIDFSKTRFTTGANFRSATFIQEVKFKDAKFLKPADFGGATFTGAVTFEVAEFSELVNFEDAKFTNGADFAKVKFTGGGQFAFATFTGKASFRRARFVHGASFHEATFTHRANFQWAQFNNGATFEGATFTEEVLFQLAEFTKRTTFAWAKFNQKANFSGAIFNEGAAFHNSIFLDGADFHGTSFKGGLIDFHVCRFNGRTAFSSRREETRRVPIFEGVDVDLRGVIINPPEALTLVEADLQKCQLLDTDIRKVQMTGVIWPRKKGRFLVYDEIAPLKGIAERPWARIERLYRELKQNYEDRRDYERAGDFHYGEKEMRRQNKKETSAVLRFLITLYWLSSGYGERYLRPLIWAALLLIACTFGYLVLGLRPKEGGLELTLTSVWDWLRAAHYSFRVMTLLKPEDLVPFRYGKVLSTIQSLLGPLLVGLFALAVRQRLKR